MQKNAVSKSEKELKKALLYSSDDVKIAAALALAKHGKNSEISKKAIAVISGLAQRKDNIIVVVSALNPLDDFGMKTISLKDEFSNWSTAPETLDKRYNSYPSRLWKVFC